MRFVTTFLRAVALPTLVGAGLAGARPAGAQPVYKFTPLDGDFGVRMKAYGLNTTGQTVGNAVDADGLSHSAHWHNEVFTDLHGTVHFTLLHPFRLYNQDYSEAYAISNGDQIVGTARLSIKCGLDPEFIITNAYILRPAVLTDLATPYPGDALTNLGTLGNPCDAYDSAAVAISNNNHVVGWADLDAGGTMHAFLVTPVNGKWYEDLVPAGDPPGDLVNDLMVDLGTLDEFSTASSATAVNDFGQVTGWSYVTPARNNPDTGGPEAGYHAFLITPLDNDGDGLGDQWFADGAAGVRNALMADLGTLGGNNSWGRGINNSGAVVGESDTATGTTRAFLWQDGTMTDLGTLDRTDSAQFRNSSASAINDVGQIVGWAEDSEGQRRAFVWMDGVMYDLNDHLLPTDDPNFTLNQARDINDNGQIVGWGSVRGTESTQAFLLTIATPEQIAAAEQAMNPPAEQEEESSGSPGSATGGASGSGSPIVGRPGNLVDSTTSTDEEPAPPAAEPAPALCGPGAVALLPLTGLGLVCLRAGRRRPRRRT